MHIQLLPATLPVERPLTTGIARVEMAPGQRVMALVLSPDAEGRSMLGFAGQHVATRTPLPFPPGTRLLLEVVGVDGDDPAMRVVEPRTTPPPAVSSASYGYAAAVLASQGAPALSESRAAVVQWLPLLVQRGILTQAQAANLAQVLGPVVPRPVPGGPERRAERRADAPTPQALADALATTLARDPVLLEARLRAALRQHGEAAADQLAGQDVRGRLAQLLRALPNTSGDPQLAEVRDSLVRLQEGLLAEQARSAAHFARDGTVDVRIPVALGADDVEVRIRVSQSPEEEGAEADAPRGRRVQLDLNLEGLGRVQVRLDAAGNSVRAELLTDLPAAADAIEGGLADLTAALSGAGFEHVLTRVAIDPVRVAAADAPLDLPPEGSIVSVDA